MINNNCANLFQLLLMQPRSRLEAVFDAVENIVRVLNVLKTRL